MVPLIAKEAVQAIGGTFLGLGSILSGHIAAKVIHSNDPIFSASDFQRTATSITTIMGSAISSPILGLGRIATSLLVIGSSALRGCYSIDQEDNIMLLPELSGVLAGLVTSALMYGDSESSGWDEYLIGASSIAGGSYIAYQVSKNISSCISRIIQR